MRLLLIFLILSPFFVQSKEKWKPAGNAVSLSYFGGKVFIHTPKIYIDAPAYSSGLEIAYRKQCTGRWDWHQRFGFPEVGINLFYSMYGSTQLGQAVAIYPSIQFRLLKYKKLYWYGRLGGGLGWVNKSWKRLPAEDTMNNVIGSALNNFTMFQSGIRWNILPHWSAQAGIHFYHLSNAAARTPNFGINTFGANVGLVYHFQPSTLDFEKRKLKRFRNPLNFNMAASIAFAEDKTPDGPLYPVLTVGLSGQKMYRNKNRIIAGMDAIYNAKVRAFIRNTDQLNGSDPVMPYQFSAFLGHEFLFGRVGFPLIAGAYLNRPVGGERIYQKLGMNWHFQHSNKRVFRDIYMSLILKTHMIQAQYAELGMGFLL